MTECSKQQHVFEGPGNRVTVATFDSQYVSSDGGAVLLKEVEAKTGILEQFSQCFEDRRNPDRIEHTVKELLSQRVFAIALGYEDLIDHDRLRVDPLLAALAGKEDLTGETRERERDRGKPLAGKSTLNRLELSACGGDGRYKKILPDEAAIDQFFLNTFFQAYGSKPCRIIIDLDATDDPVHGEQEGRFFHGYYDAYCFRPLYAFCGDHLLLADLRTADRGPAVGVAERLEGLVASIRKEWPDVEIVFRGDSDFSTDELMTFCEQRGLDYVFGVARNSRLVEMVAGELERAGALAKKAKEARRIFKDLRYQTRESWSKERRVVAKAEGLPGGKSNPRFVVTTFSKERFKAQVLYEFVYCARGDMENRIKEQQLYLFADRTSCHAFRANQLRLWLHSVAYVLMEALRRLGLEGTELERAQCHTIREKLFKVGALIKVSVRRLLVSMSESYPFRALFARIAQRLASC